MPELPPAPRASFERRWAFFFIADLNGLADQRRPAVEENDAEKILATEERMHRTLAGLDWHPAAALSGAYDFAKEKIDYPEDAWGPALIIGAIEPNRDRFSQWLGSLNHEAQRELGDLTDLLDLVIGQCSAIR